MVRKSLLKKYWFVWLMAIVLLLRLPSLFEPFTYGDEGIYLTLGQAAKQGLVWYRDIHDNKPPMLYLLAALAGDFFTYRLTLLFWSFLTLFIFYKLARALFPKNKKAIIIATSVFAIISSLHTFEGNVANAENFMLLPTITAFYLLLEKRAKAWAWPLAGVLLGLAALFKIPAAFDLAAAGLMVFFLFLEEKKRNYALYAKGYVFLILGFLTPIGLSIVYYAFHNALNQYLTAAFFQNIPYLSSWVAGQTQVGSLPIGLIIRGGLVLTLILALFVSRKKTTLAVKLVFLWFGFSLFAALLSSRPYPHYLIQVLPAFSLSFGFLAIKAKKTQLSNLKIIPLSLILTLAFTFLVFKFWYYTNLPYYLNFYQYALRLKSKEEYYDHFGNHTQSLYQTAEYLRNRNGKNEKIFIWGTEPSLYVLAKKLPVGRYATSYHIIDFNGQEETIKALKETQPRYIIDTGNENRPFPELTTLIQTYYALETQIGRFKILHKVF